jgi:hypothetical protein
MGFEGLEMGWKSGTKNEELRTKNGTGELENLWERERGTENENREQGTQNGERGTANGERRTVDGRR